MTEHWLGSPEPVKESPENDQMSDATDRLPAPGPFLEATASTGLLLLRSIDRELRVEVLVVLEEVLTVRIEG